MGLKLFKLEKLTITGYREAGRALLQKVGSFSAMFNPSSLSEAYAIDWSRQQGINASAPDLTYTGSQAKSIKVNLLLDGTGVDSIGLLSFFSPSVKDRIDKFLEVAFVYHGKTHEPNYLRLEWGDFEFDCRLCSLDIKYTLFDRDGTALRAELSLDLVADTESKKRVRQDNRQSPDLTHARTVRRGDTLPLLTKEIYGSADHYLEVARWNELDDFRNLIPGQQILFPPLTALVPSDGESDQESEAS